MIAKPYIIFRPKHLPPLPFRLLYHPAGCFFMLSCFVHVALFLIVHILFLTFIFSSRRLVRLLSLTRENKSFFSLFIRLKILILNLSDDISGRTEVPLRPPQSGTSRFSICRGSIGVVPIDRTASIRSSKAITSCSYLHRATSRQFF